MADQPQSSMDTKTANGTGSRMPAMPAVQRIIRLREVLDRVGLKRSTVYARIAGGTFPKPVPLGSPHAVGWVASEIDEWICAQISSARSDVRQ